MSKVRILVGLVIIVGAGFGWVSAKQGASGSGPLTGKDYEEIKALYARYNQGSDFQDAELFVSAFSEDGVIERANGRVEGMAALRAERTERYQGRTGRCRKATSQWEFSYYTDFWGELKDGPTGC